MLAKVSLWCCRVVPDSEAVLIWGTSHPTAQAGQWSDWSASLRAVIPARSLPSYNGLLNY